MLTFINEPIDLSEFLRLGLPEISANVLFDPIHTYVVGDPVIGFLVFYCAAPIHWYCRSMMNRATCRDSWGQ